MQSPYWILKTTLSQDYLLTIALGASDSVFLSSLKVLGWLKPNCTNSPCRIGEWKFVHGIRVKWSRHSPCRYMVITVWKFSSQDLKGRRSWNLVWYIGDSSPYKFIQIVIICWPCPTLNMKSKQFISKFNTEKQNFLKYKVQVLSAKGLRLQKRTCSPTWALVSVVVRCSLVYLYHYLKF